ncbi:hypothetical protein QR680_010980 [Steinernema hermaphroditum]|uniref:Nematode cuticle collagen N-terminal domain-containing protein n=1 Tax=Steinernema hermaphroditum TaxID=289476 RepID=A0AA39IT79_9BILA|nr:hypothetical protein QR680_010980 [Steinernema hermaphroditum]
MVSVVRVVLGAATAGSALVIIASIVVIGGLFNEVNQMYAEVLADVEETKVISNDAWKAIMEPFVQLAARIHRFSFEFAHTEAALFRLLTKIYIGCFLDEI